MTQMQGELPENTPKNGEVPKEGRVARRQRRNRLALIRAASDVMSQKGIDAATMLEIADRADVGAGTVYNYFRSKEDLALAVLEEIVQELASRIDTATDHIEDPAQIYAAALLTVFDTATSDRRWRQLLNRSGTVADVMFRKLGPLVIDLLERGATAGRMAPGEAPLTWQLTTHSIVGLSLSVTRGKADADRITEAVVRLLIMAGLDQTSAADLAARPRPALPPEETLPAPEQGKP